MPHKPPLISIILRINLIILHFFEKINILEKIVHISIKLHLLTENFEFDKTFQGKKAQAFYQVLTTTSSGGGYYESFLGDQGTLKMSENPALTKLFRENNAPEWGPLIKAGIIGAGDAAAATTKDKPGSRTPFS